MQRVQILPNLTISRLVYGTWRLTDDPNHNTNHVQAKLESCLDQGITTIDQADIYGGYTAEALMGKALAQAPHLREKMEIITKCGIIAPAGRHQAARVKHYDTSADHINASVEASLREMHTDYIDVLLIHRPDPLIDPEKTGRALDALIESGKVRSVGVSNFTPADCAVLAYFMQNALTINQIELSLETHQPLTNGDIAYMQQHKMTPMAWSPLAGGELVKKPHPALQEMAEQKNTDIAALAIAWLLHHPAAIVPVMGTNNLQRIATLSKALEINLDRQDWFVLYSAMLGREVA